MKLFEVEDRDEILVGKLLQDDFVKAIHLFLSNYEIGNIKKYVSQALNEVFHYSYCFYGYRIIYDTRKINFY